MVQRQELFKETHWIVLPSAPTQDERVIHVVIHSLCAIASASRLSITVSALVVAIVSARTLGDKVHEYESTLVFDTPRRAYLKG